MRQAQSVKAIRLQTRDYRTNVAFVVITIGYLQPLPYTCVKTIPTKPVILIKALAVVSW